jgi:regulator of sirC expression with transglutaminase-like and TPR domain
LEETVQYESLDEEELAQAIASAKAALAAIPSKQRSAMTGRDEAEAARADAAEREALHTQLGPRHEAQAFAATKDHAAAIKAKAAYSRQLDELRASEAQHQRVLERAQAELNRQVANRIDKTRRKADALLRDEYAARRDAAIEALAAWLVADAAALGVPVNYCDLPKQVAIRLETEEGKVTMRIPRDPGRRSAVMADSIPP